VTAQDSRVAQRRSLLVVVPRVPWPPRRSGFSVRYYPLLKYLSARHSVHLMIVGDREAWTQDCPFGEGCTVEYVDVSGRAPPLAARLSVIARSAWPAGAPYSIRSVWTPDVLRAIEAAGRRRPYDVVLWAGPEYLEAAVHVARNPPARRCVFDLVDSPMLIATRARSQASSAAEIKATRNWENELRRRADLTIYISDTDARASGPEVSAPTMTLPNGIYLEDLGDPTRPLPLPPGVPERYVLFFGHMSFGPNVDGAGWLASEIMPAVRAKLPDMKLVIAGHQPAPSVQALAGPDTIVTGSVESIWPYVRNAAACIFPLRLASGLQNKVLEALAMGKAVVTTRQCAAGVSAQSGVHLLAGDTASEIIEASLRVLSDSSLAQQLGAAGSRLVLSEFDWTALTRRFEQALLETPARVARA
jgi:glycosyltransferase involved in cell wall biosynthesis